MRFQTNQMSLSREEAEELLRSPRDRASLDIETISVANKLALGIAFGISADVGFYFFNPKDPMLKEVIEQTPTLLIHNAAFDIPILDKLGIKVQYFEDTMMLAYSAGILDKSLESLSETLLHKPCPSVTSQWRKPNQGNIGIDHVKMGGMSIIHACNTYALWDVIPKTRLYYEIDRPSVDLVIEMERNGVLIDQFQLTEVEQVAVVKANQMELELKEELGNINLSSNPQVATALRERGIIGTRKTKSDKDSVSEESLKPLNHPLTNKLLSWRSVMKTVTTYVPAFRGNTNNKGEKQGDLDSNGRLHTTFGNTNTGRWSSRKPNLQNITRDEKFAEEE